MIVTLSEVKSYLRVDHSEEDTLLRSIMDAAEELVLDVARLTEVDVTIYNPTVRIAVLYTIAYLYEHREEADHHELTLTLRAMLFGVREAKF